MFNLFNESEPVWFYVTALLFSTLILLTYIFYLKWHFKKTISGVEKRLLGLEKDFEIVKQRNRANLEIFKKVVHGFDGIVENMKYSIEEEERKLKELETGEVTVTNLVES